MDKKIENIESALVIVAEAIESGQWQGLENDVRKILEWPELTPPSSPEEIKK